MRRRIRFQGRVQGVGFRATTTHIVRASGLPLTGWVRNEPDGAVTLVIDGAPPDVDRVLDDLRATMRACITSEREEPADDHEPLQRFEVRR